MDYPWNYDQYENGQNEGTRDLPGRHTSKLRFLLMILKFDLRGMILLVSFPRSGNTFVRNVMYEVYGIQSSTYLLDGHGPDPDWSEARVVKTHHLPNELPTNLMERKVVYLVRDGRDAAVSFAHHRKDIVAPESEFVQNLEEVTYAAEGSHFGGWSLHVESWILRADLVVRFEELIHDPLAVCAQIAELIELPEPNAARLPSFQQLKEGTPEYGSGKYTHEGALSTKWFRKGKVGSWKEEMTQEQSDLFWHLHGETMEHMGYRLDGEIGRFTREAAASRRILIEASKLQEPFVDGVGRYVRELIKAAYRYGSDLKSLYVRIGKVDLSLTEVISRLKDEGRVLKGRYGAVREVARTLLPSSVYNWLASTYASRQRLKVQGQSTATQYDGLLIPLPQHFHFVEDVEANRVVGVVHDLTHRLFPEMHQPNNVRLAETGLDSLRKKAASFISVSDATCDDLTKLGIQSTVILEGVDRRRFFPVRNVHLQTLIKERYNLPNAPFILSVGTLEPRKNLQRVIDAFASLGDEYADVHLVVAGRKGWMSKLSIPTQIRERIHATGFVREDHLPALYSLSLGFCYISLYEGFGLPVLEAMACGKPVLVSDRASLPQVVGEVGIQCDPEDSNDIVEGLTSLVEEGRNVDPWKYMRHTWDFTWRKTWLRTEKILYGQKGKGEGEVTREASLTGD